MVKVDELKLKLADLKNKAEGLKVENKIDEALEVVNSIKELKKEIEIEEALNQEETEKIENKLDGGNVIMEKQEIMNKEEKVFINFIREGIRNDMKAGDNGVLIPNTISAKIIEKVYEISPLYARATKFNLGGDLTFAKENAIPTVAYVDEMAVVTSSDATFTTVKLGSFIAGALAKISRSLLNRSDFDLLAYVINAIAKSIAKFLEKELIVGTTNKIEGLKSVTPVTVAKLDADALIDLQMAIPSALQGACEFLMNPADVKAVRKLKATDGTYVFQADPTTAFGYRLLGKNIMVSDNVPANTVFYGDFSGLYVKIANDVEVSVLNEKFADQYAVGVLAYVELDAKVVENQKISALKVTTA